MERTQIFDLMSELKLYGMKTPMMRSWRLISDSMSRRTSLAIFCRPKSAKTGALDQISDLDRQSFLGEGSRRLPVRRTRSTRPRARSRPRRLSRRAAQLRPGRRHRTGKTHLAIAIARNCIRRQTRPLLQHRRSRQSARDRSARRTAGRIAEYLIRKDFVVPMNSAISLRPDRWSAAVQLISQLYERTSIM